jgi:hypothetical protein
MRDYSLESVAKRDAAKSDKIVTSGFQGTVSRGFAFANDHTTAACLRPGTEIAFEKKITDNQGKTYPYTTARFFQLSKEECKRTNNYYRDALMLPNGTYILLNNLYVGQHAKIIQMPAEQSAKVLVSTSTSAPAPAVTSATAPSASRLPELLVR